MFPQVNFWLNSILLPWTHLQRFLHSDNNDPRLPYRVPVEWTPHRRTLMVWPDGISIESDDQLNQVRTEVASIAETIAMYESVWLCTSIANAETAGSCVSSENVTIKKMELEALWVCDTGPVLAESQDGELVGLDLSQSQSILRTRAPFTFEGGALHVDGQGTLLATESSVKNPNRNPDVIKKAAEREFHDLLGITKTIWLPGLTGLEATDGHVDLLARFAPNHTVLLSRPNAAVPGKDDSWRIYRETKEILRLSTNAVNRSMRIVEIEEALTVPYARIADSGQRMATSYLNYYLPEGAVVVPQFGDEILDEEALRVLREVWSDRESVGVNLDILPWMGGGMHCATMQWPRKGSDGKGAYARVWEAELR